MMITQYFDMLKDVGSSNRYVNVTSLLAAKFAATTMSFPVGARSFPHGDLGWPTIQKWVRKGKMWEL